MSERGKQKPRVRANGEGTVFQRRDGRLVAALFLPDGSRKYWYPKTKEQGRKLIAEARRQLAAGEYVVDERQTVERYLSAWLEAIKPNLRYSVWVRYGEYLRLHALPALGRKRLVTLTGLDLQRLYADRLAAGLSPTSVRHLHGVLHRAFEDARRWGQLANNPADRATPPKRSTAPRPTLSPEEVRRLLETARGDRLEALIVCALTLGMREGELCGLRWEAVDVDDGTLRVVASLARQEHGRGLGQPKTAASRRTLRLPRVAIDALRRHRLRQQQERLAAGPAWQDTGLVFTRTDGRPLAAQHLAAKFLRPLLARAGLPPVRFHDLRHTYATLGLRQHVPLRLVSDALGHASIGVTANLYQHVTEEMQGQVAEAIDGLFDGS